MDLTRMRLGCRWPSGRVHVPAPLPGAVPIPGADSRIIGTPRVAGDNSVLGDCVPTGCANAVQTAMARAGVMTPIPDAVPIAAYSAVTGYTPGDPATDQGTDPLAMFSWWRAHDLAGYRLRGFTPIDPQSEYAVRRTIDAAGGVGFVVALSSEQQSQSTWLPLGTPGSWGEHFVWADAFDGALTFATSWGAAMPIDRSYFQAAGFVLAAYAIDVVPT